MANYKYEFTGETRYYFGITLKQIKRKSDGAIDEWIESEKNLDTSGDAQVSGNSRNAVRQ